MALREITMHSVCIRILAALIVGGILGLERERKSRAAGLRTYMLVCVGACLIMLTNQFLYQTTGAGDPMRLGAQVVSGIGFLGAGTIIVTKRSQIKGLTTAAGLWSSAAVGLSLGVGFYEAGLVAGATIYFVMTVLRHWDIRMRRSARYIDCYIEYTSQASLSTVLQKIRKLDLDIDGIETFPGAPDDPTRALTISLKSPKRTDHDTLLKEIQHIDGVLYAKEL